MAHTYLRLPGKLGDELGILRSDYDGVRRGRNGPRTRKEIRKAARVEKKPKHAPIQKKAHERILPVESRPKQIKPTPIISERPKSILKVSKKDTTPSPPSSPRPIVSRQVKKKLSEDDAEIAALERALGVKNPSKLPKSFEDDGLDELLDGLDDDTVASGTSLGKRQRPEGYEWLERKRQKAQAAAEVDESSSESEVLDDEISGEDPFLDEPHGRQNDDDDSEDEGSVSFDGFDENESASENEPGTQVKQAARLRENPYVAPPNASNEVVHAKYVPPSLRNNQSSQTEELSRLRKQVQGLLNRLSEANMLSIVGDIEKLYLTNPRQDVSTTVLDVLIGLLSDPTTLQDTFLILHGGLIAALYKTVGTEFGAQAIQQIDAEFSKHYEKSSRAETVDKKLLNLVNLIADLYNFQIIGSVLIYDLIRQLLSEFSETNTELLLKIVRIAGPQLRQDDPSSLKAIVLSLQQQIAEAGEKNISTKMKFMMEMMNDLKNNRMKTGIAASSITSEHMIRMKKTLGTLNQKRVKASEPLRISLKDLRDSDKKGKWWLVGSSYKGEAVDAVLEEATRQFEKDDDEESRDFLQDNTSDLLQLAKEQRMNTSVRQAIFIAIMSATDCNDAYLRLIKLRLKKSQELEIPKVVLHCAKSEENYNPYYTLLARKLCSDRKFKMAFQFSFWDIFKQLDGENQEFEDESEDEETTLGLRAIVNLARTFGSLVADGGLGLGVLKNLNLAYLQPSMQTFVEVLLCTLTLQVGKVRDEALREKALFTVFMAPKEMPDMARGLYYFMRKYVSKSDITGDKGDRDVIKWGCKVAGRALKEIMNTTVYEA